MEDYLEGGERDPKKALLFVLILLATSIFVLGLISLFSLSKGTQEVLVIAIGIVFIIALIAFVFPIKRGEEEPSQESESNLFKNVEIMEDPALKEIEKLLPEVQELDNKKTKSKGLKYFGSSENKKYHLKTCRFAKKINKKFLEKKSTRKYFKSKKYSPCKVCKPHLN